MCFFLIDQRYIQPARSKSCKPCISYKRPEMPFESNTVYRNSFPNITPCEAALCRLPPVRPLNSITMSPHIKMEKETVTSVRNLSKKKTLSLLNAANLLLAIVSRTLLCATTKARNSVSTITTWRRTNARLNNPKTWLCAKTNLSKKIDTSTATYMPTMCITGKRHHTKVIIYDAHQFYTGQIM